MNRTSPFSELVSLLMPDVLEKAHADAEEFIASRTGRSGQAAIAELVADSHNLIAQFGKPVEQALYALLCQDSELRPTLNEALGGGVKSGVALVVPILVGQFALAPTVALVVATLVIKTFATRGQKTLCAELESGAERPKAKSKKRPSKLRPQAKTGLRKSKPKAQAATQVRPKQPTRTRQPKYKSIARRKHP